MLPLVAECSELNIIKYFAQENGVESLGVYWIGFVTIRFASFNGWMGKETFWADSEEKFSD